MSRRVFANSSPLILLHRINRLGLLRDLFGQVTVPRAVVEELRQKPGYPSPLTDSDCSTWVVISDKPALSEEVLAWDLGHGESAVIQSAIAEPESLVIIDDLAARKCARSFRVETLGTVGVVVLAKKRGLVPRVRGVLEELRGAKMRVSEKVILAALVEVGEADG